MPRVNIIASRDHLCVNPNNTQMKGRVLEKACNEMVGNKTCIFKQGEKMARHGWEPLKI